MSREATRQSMGQEAAHPHLRIRVSQHERTVRVALSGILDEAGVVELAAQTARHLRDRGLRIVLDGSRLVHLDYRATRLLIQWNRQLRRFHHQLYLLDWNDYLKAILCMEDWDRELGGMPAGAATWRLLSGAPTYPMP